MVELEEIAPSELQDLKGYLKLKLVQKKEKIESKEKTAKKKVNGF